MKKDIVASAALFTLVAALAGCVGELTGDEAAQPSEAPYQLGNPHLRIAVVGAGPSGLTAAHELEKRGYQNVVVFEKDSRVGGKVNTLKQGTLSAELGAVFASPDYDLTLGLADEYGIPYVEYVTPRYVYDSSIPGVPAKKTYQEFLLQHYTIPQIVAATQNYGRVLQMYPQIFADSLANLPPELEQNFQAFAEQQGIVPVAEMAKSLIVGFGYGYYTDVPAIYMLKIMNMLVKVGPAGLESPTFFSFPTGYQSLWEAVAKDLDVRLSSRVTRVARTEYGIDVYINGASSPEEFDAVLISAPLSAVPSFVDLSRKELELFAQVESSRYFVTLFAASNLQGGETVFVHDNANAEQINRPSVWANRSGSSVFITYQLATRTASIADITKALAEDILSFGGGAYQGALVRKEWTDYFPRVNAANMAAGFYDQVEALQGRGKLYYIGGTLSFETVETSARYARSLVRSRFPATAVVAP